jgi:hypothetical protein
VVKILMQPFGESDVNLRLIAQTSDRMTISAALDFSFDIDRMEKQGAYIGVREEGASYQPIAARLRTVTNAGGVIISVTTRSA